MPWWRYSDDAVVITPQGTLRGRAQIQGMIEGVITEFARPGVQFTLLHKAAEGPVVKLERGHRLGDALDGADDVEPGAGQHAAVAAAVEKPRAETRLQRVQPAEHRRPIDGERIGRRLHRAAAMNGKNDPQMIPFEHRPSIAELGLPRAPAGALLLQIFPDQRQVGGGEPVLDRE